MECVKQHNKLWSCEAMFLHDYLEVPVTKAVHDAHATSCPPTPTATRVDTPDGVRSEEGGSSSGEVSPPTSLPLTGSHSRSPGPASPASPAPSLDYSDTLPCDFLSKIDSNIAVMKSSIERLESNNKYDDPPAMAQMEVDDSFRKTSNGSGGGGRSWSRPSSSSARLHDHRTDSNGGFPFKNGHIITARNSRFVNHNGSSSAASNGGGGFGSSNGGCFAMVNGGYLEDDDVGGILSSTTSPTAPPDVAVVGGKNNKSGATVIRSSVSNGTAGGAGGYHSQRNTHQQPNGVVSPQGDRGGGGGGGGVIHNSSNGKPSATRTITMSLKRLLRDQEELCPL